MGNEYSSPSSACGTHWEGRHVYMFSPPPPFFRAMLGHQSSLKEMASLSNPKFSFRFTINVANFITLKLNDNNYLLWETQVLSLIMSQDLLGFLTGKIIALPKMSTSEKGAIINNPNYTS
uniref:Retrotransposon Copia-like N-terminal domain-containing protein n=1 Tax=Ananas comosus var. bracteatus TaxID=296719 RepID=A0A6V7P202_ANACO|nr:unnamed protein product [Ananas comosus var. bracteatus]